MGRPRRDRVLSIGIGRGVSSDPREDRRHAAPAYDSAAPRKRLREEWGLLLRHRPLILQMVRRNLTLRYKRSFLGILWTLLDPLLTMAIMAVVFGALFSTSVPRYPIFLFSGLLVWNLIAQASTQAMGDLVYGGYLLGRMPVPRSIFAVAAVVSGLANTLLALGPLAILMFAYRGPMTASLLFLPVALAMGCAFALGLGLAVSALAVFFADLMNIYSIGLRLVMYLSGVFYVIEQLPSSLRGIVWANPIFHLVTLFRDPVYAGTMPGVASILVGAVASLAVLWLGFEVFVRLSDEIAYRI